MRVPAKAGHECQRKGGGWIMELSVRKKTILAALVEDYIENAEPVGS